MSKSKFGSKFFGLFKKSKNKEESDESNNEYHELDDDSINDELNDEINNENIDDKQQYEEFESEEFEELDLTNDNTADLPPPLTNLNELDDLDSILDKPSDTTSNGITLKEDDDSMPPSIPQNEFENEYEDNFEYNIPKQIEHEDEIEKTLGEINLEKFREENSHLVNDQTNSDYDLNSVSFNEMRTPSKNSKFNFKGINFSKPDTSKLDTINLEAIIQRFFSTQMRPTFHRIFILTLSATTFFVIGKIGALFINLSSKTSSTALSSGQSVIRRPLYTQEINKITSTNLFDIKNSENEQIQSGPKTTRNFVCFEASKPTSEPLTLVDTVVLQDSVKSIASVQMRGQRDLINVREGETVANNVEVSKIQRLRLILKNRNTGECEYVQAADLANAPTTDLKIYPASKANQIFKSLNPEIKNQGNNFSITKKYRDNMLGNLSEILTQAKAVQITNPDGSLSFKMTEVIPGSIYSQLNIQNDDIITSINGKKIQNLNELTTLLGKIREIDQFQIGVSRNGTQENLEYNFQ